MTDPAIIIRHCIAVTGVDSLLPTSRTASVVRAREVAVSALRTISGMSFPEIADAIGLASHTSALDAWRRARARWGEVAPLVAEVRQRAEKEPSARCQRPRVGGVFAATFLRSLDGWNLAEFGNPVLVPMKLCTSPAAR